MSIIIIGIGDIKVSDNQDDILKTFALGSCVAVIMFDPQKHVAGMAHIALPDSSIIHHNKSESRPAGYFADMAIPALIDKMAKFGCSKNGRGLIIKLAGGAAIMDPNGIFDIGKRNLLTIKKILWAKGMGAMAEDVGGNISRTVTLMAYTGEVSILSSNSKRWNI